MWVCVLFCVCEGETESERVTERATERDTVRETEQETESETERENLERLLLYIGAPRWLEFVNGAVSAKLSPRNRQK